MATFAIYTYKFRNVENVGMYLGQEDDRDLLPTLKDKQDFLQKIFHDDLNGGRMFECYIKKDIQDSKTKKKNKEKVKYGSKVVWEQDGLILLMISNPYKSITRHEKFRKIKEMDDPWCHVLIDNRFGRQFIAIEKNAAFDNQDFVGEILECSLKDRFTPHHATIEVKNQYEPDAFWDVVDKYKSNGIQRVSFMFSAPNNPWATELIGCFNEAARGMNARTTTEFIATDNGELLLEKSNDELNKYIEACAMEGEDIVFKVKGIRSFFHIKNVKNKYVLKQLTEEVFQQILQMQPELFDENFTILTSFMDQIKTSKEKQREEEKK